MTPLPNDDGVDLSVLSLDAMERDLIPILRHFLTAMTDPASQTWHLAYATASEKWGPSVGLAMAHALAEFVRAAQACRPDGYHHHDALDLQTRHRLTVDEAMLMLVIHYTRRDRTDQARVALENATLGRRDARMIRAALAFARRYGTGAMRQPGEAANQPALTLVS